MEYSATSLSTLTDTATPTIEWNQATFSGTEADLNVFSISESDFESLTSFTFDVLTDSLTIINVSGTNVQIPNVGYFFQNGSQREKILYNFYEATSISMHSVEVSVLAPFADITFPSGVILGNLVGKSLSGNGQSNHVPFEDGCPDSPPPNTHAYSDKL